MVKYAMDNAKAGGGYIICTAHNIQIDTPIENVVAFTWVDYATNETGYRLIPNDQAVIELPANTTAYKDIYTFVAGEKILYQIEVYNITGFTRSAVISITC